MREAHAQFQASLSSAHADFDALAQLDKQIKSFNVGANPYTWFTMEVFTFLLIEILKKNHFILNLNIMIQFKIFTASTDLSRKYVVPI